MESSERRIRKTLRRIRKTLRRIRKTLRRLPAGARRELLDLLAAPPEVRADAIRQLHERRETEDLAEVLIDLEAEPILRLGVMDALKDSTRR
jgi:uncharacterized protein (UPF0216 family)